MTINIGSHKVTMTDGTIYRFVDPFVNLGDVLNGFVVAPPFYLLTGDEDNLRLDVQLATPGPQFVNIYMFDQSAITTPPTSFNGAFGFLTNPVPVNRSLIEKIEGDTPITVTFP